MNFCIISPAAGLQQFATLSKTHLVLSHVDNAIYTEFYRQRRDAGDLVILDNGAYEGRMDPEKLLEKIVHYRPQVIVLPDILMGDAKESFELARDFHKTWRSQVECQWMYVPQTKLGDSVAFHYYLQKAIDDIKPEWIGIPRVLATDHKGHRDACCREIHFYNPEINVHALGMKAGSLEELELLRDSGCTSIDSSAPVWRGWCNVNIDNYAYWNEYGSECDFDAYPLAPMDPRIKLIMSNLTKCGVKTNGIQSGTSY